MARPIVGDVSVDVARIDRPRILNAAGRYIRESPVTITAARSPRSAGGVHDYFSEGDYWWPDPANPDGPYIQRDGLTNPDNMYHDGWPVRHVSLLFGGIALERPDYLDLWRRLDPDPTVDEIVRNYPVRQPVLWARPR